MNPSVLMLPAVPLLLAGLGWWGGGSLAPKLLKPQPAPVVAQIVLPPGIELLAPAGPRPPLGYLELAAFGFTEPTQPLLAKAATSTKAGEPRVLTAGDYFVVDSVLSGPNLNTATIGHRTVKVGDQLDHKYTVMAIARDGVWVQGSDKRAEQERIGFRTYVMDQPTAQVTTQTAKPAPPSVPAAPAPDGVRDFRQLLDALKL